MTALERFHQRDPWASVTTAVARLKVKTLAHRTVRLTLSRDTLALGDQHRPKYRRRAFKRTSEAANATNRRKNQCQHDQQYTTHALA